MEPTRLGLLWWWGEVDGEVNDVDEGGEEEHWGVVFGVGEVGYDAAADCGAEKTKDVIKWQHARVWRVGVGGGGNRE